MIPTFANRDIVPPCIGKHELFDSRDLVDHKQARAICATCPLITECMTNLLEVKRAPANLGGSPAGTWAGMLQGEPTRYRERKIASDPMTGRFVDCGSETAYKRHLHYGELTCDACRAAHVNYQRDKPRSRTRKAAS